jgi:hypothetical protein
MEITKEKAGMNDLRGNYLLSYVIALFITSVFDTMILNPLAHVLYSAGEFLLDTNVVYVGAPFNQSSPAISFDGNNYFVVWQDNRNGNNDIYGARVSQSGVVLDPTGIKICCTPDDQKTPAVAFDGFNYLVVWSDNRMGNFDIYGARVSTTGIVIDSNAIAIFVANNSQHRPAIAFGDSNYLVVWEDFRGGLNIYGSRVSPDGLVLDPAGIPISVAPLYQSIPAVAFGDTFYFVIWVDERNGIADVYGTRVLRSGAVVDTTGIAICLADNVQWKPAIYFGSDIFLAVWQDKRNNSDYDIYGTRISTSGVILDPSGIQISVYDYDQVIPGVSFSGMNFFIVWEDYRNMSWTTSDIYGSRVTQYGSVLDPYGIVICDSSRDEYSPCLSFNGTEFFTVWQQGSGNGTGDIVGIIVDTNGYMPDSVPKIISTTAYDQQSPTLGFDGNNYLVIWQDGRCGSSYTDIYGSRITPAGGILEPSGIPICVQLWSQMNPSLSFDGINFLAVWQDHSTGWVSPSILGTRVNQQGIVLDSAFVISTWANYWHGFPDVCFGDTFYLCSWWDNRSGYYHDDIYGARVDPSGIVLDSLSIPLCIAQDSQFFSTISFADTTFLVVWDDWRNGNWDIFGCRVTNNGIVLEPNGFIISTALFNQRTPDIAFGAGNHFVVWSDYRNSNWDIYGTRITPNGVVLDPNGIAICKASNIQSYPAVTFDGTNYIVVWQDYRSGTEYDIYGAVVTPGGAVIDSFEVSTQQGDQLSPALVHGPARQILIVWAGLVDSINGNLVNTLRIWGKFYPFAGVEERTSKESINQSSRLFWAYPNPFSDYLTIKFLGARWEVGRNRNLVMGIKIYDATGKLVRNFSHPSINQQPRNSVHSGDQLFDQIIWDGADDSGRKLSQGVYFIYLDYQSETLMEKVIMLK